MTLAQTYAPSLELLRAARRNVHRICAAFSVEELNRIPAGLNNNLIWNAGHLIATLEGLTYGLSGLPQPSGPDFIARYRKGTAPHGDADAAECARILDDLLPSVDRFAADLDRLDWSNYREYATSFGVTLHDLGDAITFNNMHETLHLGAVLTQRTLLRGRVH